jgi:hypothetical protein
MIAGTKRKDLRMPTPTLFGKSIALLFSKRSTRTRLSAETSAQLLGGSALFLGRDDIQLGVNESVRDSARVIGGMCEGIFARVGDHEDIEVCSEFFFPHGWEPRLILFESNLQSIHQFPSSTLYLHCGTQLKLLLSCLRFMNMPICFRLKDNRSPLNRMI